MKTKFFTFLLTFAASVGTICASDTQVNGIWYDFNSSTKTATVTYRGNDYLFYSTRYTGDVVIPSTVSYNDDIYNVTSIGTSAFRGCSGLTSINIPVSITSIGLYAFDGCSNLTSIVWNAISCSYSGGLNSPFSSISSKITSFTFGDEVYTIPGSLCSGMKNLGSITIPSSVFSIGEYAFYNCTGLTSIDIPASYISDYAFGGCSNLTSVTIGENVVSIDQDAFSGCSGITSVTWNAINGECFSYTSNYEKYYYEPFRAARSRISSFTFGENVRHIQDLLCYEMTRLTSITIPKNVQKIGERAFQNCTGISSINWNAIYCESASSYIYSPFYHICDNINSFIIGEDVKSIPDYLCFQMKNLSSIVIPNSVKNIGKQAFYSCTGLTNISIPNSVQNIGDETFLWCSSLTSLTIPNPNAQCGTAILGGCFALEQIIVPASALTIHESGVNSAPSHVQSITVNGGEISETGFAFITHSYRTLQNLDLAVASNTTIADEAFKGCYNLQSLSLPANLSNVSYMAVAGCKNLQSIDIPASVVEIEQSAFEDCRSLQTITFGGVQPASVSGRKNALASSNSQLRKIGNWAFYNAHQLQYLEIPEGVEEIGDGAFYGCTYMEDLVLPASVQSIGDNTFSLCAKLQKIIVNAPVPPTIQAKTFFDVKRQIPVYVPDECVETYMADALWGEFNIQGISHMQQGIDDPSTQFSGSQKLLRDGQILILCGDKIYTLTGQEIK